MIFTNNYIDQQQACDDVMTTRYIAYNFFAALNKHTENNALETCLPAQSQNILSLSKSSE